MNATTLQRPIFVVGAGRSGTTLLRSLLSAHDRISLTPETHLLKRFRAWGWDRGEAPEDFDAFWRAYTANVRFADMDVDAERVLELLEAQGDRTFRSIYVAVLLAYQQRVGAARVGDKTPGNVYFVPELLDWFPDARVLVLQRDPRSVLASKMRAPWHVEHLTPRSLREGILTGSRAVELVEQADNWNRIYGDIVPDIAHDDRVRIVPYERLVTDVEVELRAICAFLGEEFDPGMIADRSATNVPDPAGNAGTDLGAWRREHHAAALGPVTTGSMEKWREDLSTTELALVEGWCATTMRAAGYTPSTPSWQRTAGRLIARSLPASASVEGRVRSLTGSVTKRAGALRSGAGRRRGEPGAPARPVVELVGPWLKNKGDVLVLNTVARLFEGSRYELGVSTQLGLDALPDSPSLWSIRERPAVRSVLGAVRRGELVDAVSLARWLLLLTFAPRAVLRRLGYVDRREVVALFDASGFAYGDQWGTGRIRRRSAYYGRLRERGTRLVLLPQALGPFDVPEMRQHTTEMLRRFDLVVARDDDSLGYLADLGLDEGVVHDTPVPDITHLLPGPPPADPEAWASRVCIVPNARMLDKASEEVAGEYAAFVDRCVRMVRDRGYEPYLVLHEANDAELARTIQARFEFHVPVLDDDAVVAKGYLGACHAVIASRYHALVSSLSQATPSMGTSWSTHKYEALFDAYGCPENLVSPLADPGELDRRMEQLLDPEHQQELRARLATAAETQTARVDQLWREVQRLLAMEGG